jgi:hypothetical protein
MPIKGTYYNDTLGAAPTANTELGGSTIINFTTTTVSPGTFVNTPSVTLPAGIYYVIINPNFQPGSLSTATFTNIAYYIGTATNGTGTNFFTLNDTNLKITESNGNAGTYSTLYQVGIIKIASSQTLYGSVQINYTLTGGNNGTLPAGTPGYTYYYRIA